MALPNSIPLFTIPKVFFYPLFRQCHCHNCQKFIPSILAMPLPQTIFFSSHFWQCHCHNCQKKIFSHHLVFLTRTQAAGMGRRNCGNIIAENQKFLSPTFVEFRQWYCRNSLSFLRLLNKLK